MTDGLVYVDPGDCGLAARSCLLLTVGTAGALRVLYVRIDTRRPNDLMGSIGHELQHAIEVLGDVRVTNDTAIEHFFRSVGIRAGGNFETKAAVDVGNAVRAEVLHHAREATESETTSVPSTGSLERGF
jgi:hypothetical protein